MVLLQNMHSRGTFWFLTRHFFDRFFDRESISSRAEPRASVIQAIGLVAVPGVMVTFMFIITSIPITPPVVIYFYVAYSMTVTGILMVFKWDSIFFDRRDYLILGGLPIRYRDLFAAKLTALVL